MINEKIIQKLTHPVSFERGLKYYQQGRVTKYSNLGNRLSAEVIGTGVYRVNIDLSDLEVSCNCPAAERQDFCKHQIAVLLTYAKGEVKAKSTPKIKASQDNRPKSETRISELLVNMTKEEILLHLDKLSIREPVIQTYFTKVVSAIGSFDYKNFRKYIRSKIRGGRLAVS